MARARPSFSTPLRQKIFTSTTVPSMPGGVVSEASRTSPDFSPKIALSSFSSGVSWVSPLAVLSPIGAGAIGQDLAPLHLLAPLDDGPLVDTGVLVAALEFGQAVDVGPEILALAGVDGTVVGHPDDHPLGVHVVHHPVPLGHDH